MTEKKNQGQQFISEVQRAVEDSYKDAGRPKGMPALNEVRNEATRLGLTEADAEDIFNYWLGNGFKAGKAGVRDWKAVIARWKLKGWFESQKGKPARAQVDAKEQRMLETMRRMQARDSNSRHNPHPRR